MQTRTTIWLSPTDLVTGDPVLQISYPSVNHPSTDITSSEIGNMNWISMGLRLPQDIRIDEVTICYQVSNPQSFISQIQLTEMKTPNQVNVRYDEFTMLNKTDPPECHTSHVGGIMPSVGTSVTLALRLNFNNIGDKIMLGAIGIKIYFIAKGCSINVRDYGAIGDGVIDDTDPIQAAEDAAVAFSGVVFFPPGCYIINGAKAVVPDPQMNPSGTRRYGIYKKSNTKWTGCGFSSSILKLKNNSTSNITGVQKVVDPQMIYANAKLNDIGFYGLGFDLNGANNPLPTLANVAAIWFDGACLEVHGMVVEDCKFYNGPGATVILGTKPVYLLVWLSS